MVLIIDWETYALASKYGEILVKRKTGISILSVYSHTVGS